MTDATCALEAIRWIRRVGNHVAQIVDQLQAAAGVGVASPSIKSVSSAQA